MILYRVLRAFGRLALRWFYRDIEVLGLEHLPARGPVPPIGTYMIPGTDPPSGLSKEMLLYSTPFAVESTVFFRFSGALAS